MGRWFRKPNREAVECLGYSFWLLEGLTCLRFNVVNSIKCDSKWDVRFWLGMLAAPFLLAALPLMALNSKRIALTGIDNNEGFSVANKSNIEMFTLLNDAYNKEDEQ